MPTDVTSYQAYRNRRHDWDGFSLVHGTYDGLTTGAIAHPHLQLLIPLGGRIRLDLTGGATTLGAEGAIALPPGHRHAATTLGGTFEFLALNAPAAWLPALCEALDAPAPTHHAVLLAGAGPGLQARQLAQALDRTPPGLERFLAAGVEQLGLYVAAALAAPRAVPEASEVDRAVALLVQRHAEPLRIEEVARELAISPRHLERRFKAAIGVPPRRFLIAVRLAAARELLAGGDEAIATIAERVGFQDASHFARAFRAEAGLTPGAYRALKQQL